MSQAGDPAVHRSVRRAKEVVGLYGDPLTTWGIGVELTFAELLDLSAAAHRLDLLVKSFPHLGRTPVVEVVAMHDWAERRQRCLSRPFGDDGFLVRVMVDGERRRLFVAAHHGVCDGLGLLAIADCVADAALVPRARGIGGRSGHQSFLRSSVLRLLEALVRPPVRFLGEPGTASCEERAVSAELSGSGISSTLVCLAVARVYDGWPRRVSPGRRRLLILLGASRRERGTVSPDRQTAYFRVPVNPRWTPAEARRRFAAIDPEPDFPETSAGGIGPWITHLLRNRLGGTAVVSNLGVVEGAGLRGVAMYPALNGPQAVGFGVATAGSLTTVTVRTRASEFSEREAQALLESVVAEIRTLATSPPAT